MPPLPGLYKDNTLFPGVSTPGYFIKPLRGQNNKSIFPEPIAFKYKTTGFNPILQQRIKTGGPPGPPDDLCL